MKQNVDSNRKKVFITGRIPSLAYEILSKEFDVTMHDDLRLLSKEEIIAGLKGKDALLCLLSDAIDKDIIEANPQLKVIANYGAGYNNIDIAAAGEANIPVTNTPDVSTDATADLTFGLILAIARRIVEGDKETRAGRFKGWAPLYHLGVDVTGKTLGIIGMGNIGKAIARRAKGFDMKIVYTSRTRLSEQQEKELGFTYMSLEGVLKTADFVSLSLSYSPATHHMIGERELETMKPSAYLINTARGPLVDEKALLKALENKSIAGAALDVYEFEPQITAGLEKLDQVILTPHIGNATVETRDAMAEIAAGNIAAVLRGEAPLTCVNQNYLKKRNMAAK
ncbi:2-hydroxyacid dehydrogenase family protein [Desulfitobacterium hafniense]|uniref:Glyoxylate reductase n=5 Tax=root TaxID=1 RepID=Q24Q83_DESHY|nr:2-hydroxyacid dehydrogenase family protein [Desulfitobacterium hafniense]ACL19400.1 D-isomer specific 2-hydroxyacid dehydrogenase NAD-binding [Desulfitobacterium hafniense DCB-2]EHL03963.1 glyoxylate reductase [Desulfitobacterium hafniense DP7]KTE90885.1 D-glycerate dehydrogenase [Desulfitobacterium hafniense]MEA5025141.1 2-hydroxyacid dehydrogenase family protein [Desulfitobacterium hafniense]CDX04241.1 Glyoxylate reductase [Desulfitobacterium hafniense]